MKILFLTRWYPPYAGIFIERHAQAVALHQEVTILAVLPGNAPTGAQPVLDHLPGHPESMVIRYFYRPSKCRVTFVASLFNLLRFFRLSLIGYRYAVKHQGPFDILHVHILSRTALLPYLLNRWNGTPFIISEHWTRYFPENWGFSGIVRRTVTRLMVRRAAAVTTISLSLRNAMQDCGLNNKRFIIIPNAIDTDLFTPAKRPPVSGLKRILHVSNLHEAAKNIHGILRVISLLKEQRQDFEMVFVGGNEPYWTEVRKYASSLGLAIPEVIFKGIVMPPDISVIYQESAFLLMFSNFESFSVVIPEALSCGIPVLTTPVGGIPEYFTEQSGRFSPTGDEAQLLENLNFMLDHSASFDPKMLRDLVEKRFGFETIGKQFSDLYQTVNRSQ